MGKGGSLIILLFDTVCALSNAHLLLNQVLLEFDVGVLQQSYALNLQLFLTA
jgi:hypothetical protein